MAQEQSTNNRMKINQNTCSNCKNCVTTFSDSMFPNMETLSKSVSFSNSGRYKDTFFGYCSAGHTTQAQSWWFANGNKTQDEQHDAMSCFEMTESSEHFEKMLNLLDDMSQAIDESKKEKS
jgi:hypothetical protein